MTDSQPQGHGVVLHAVSSGGLYGIESMLLNLLPELQQQGCPVALLCLDGPETEVGKAAQALGVTTVFVDCARRITPRGWVDLYRAIASGSPRLLHVHGYKATILAGAAALAQGIPTVATCHSVAANAGEHSRSLSWYLALETLILRRLPGVVAVSDQIAQELAARRVPNGSIRVIFNGIATPVTGPGRHPRPHQPQPFHPCILSLSRLVAGKNIHLIIDAVAALRAEFPDIGLIVAGDGPLLNDLRKHASAAGLQDSIRFPGFVRDVPLLYESCDVFVLASQSEGMPIAVLEAMALGTPIVASRVGGVPLMLNDGTEALLVEPDDQRSLYKALRRMVADKVLQSKLATAARKRFQGYYTAEHMARSYIGFYNEVEQKLQRADQPRLHP